jgi:hypothetical protein
MCFSLFNYIYIKVIAMKPLFTESEFNLSSSKDLLPCECYQCGKSFLRSKKYINDVLNPKLDKNGKFCSKICSSKYNSKRIICVCKNCNTEFEKISSEFKRFPNNFCSRSCSVSYNNKHKTTGNRRSKLELWLQEQLTKLYPNLEIHYNKTSAINSELDIYIPSLNLAFELNGIFHYEPIFGVNKLQRIQQNDISKSKACHDAKIDLCVIDTSGHKYVKPSTSQKYLDIILNIIKERL